MSAAAPSRSPLPLLGAPPATHTGGPPLLAKGFRPFFLLAALVAALGVPVWVLSLFGAVPLGGYLDPMAWHAHEMVFGFGASVVAGFLLTAVGNWTGRETATGWLLAALAALWAAGRIALVVPGLPPALVAAVDAAFLPALAATIGRPILAARNRRNVVMVLAVLLLAAANAWVHLDALGFAVSGRRTGVLVGVDLLVVLIAIIAGRVFPMFTRNATHDDRIRSHPALDAPAIASLVVVTALDAFCAPGVVLAVACATAAVLAAARAGHWGARRSVREPLLWILHVGYAWIPIGLGLRVLAHLDVGVSPAAATHALTAGAIGCVTLGMMARVSLGHTGRPLVAPRAAVVAFGLVTSAAVLRVAGPLLFPAATTAWLAAAATLWATAFCAFVVGYAPMLARPRSDGRPG